MRAVHVSKLRWDPCPGTSRGGHSSYVSKEGGQRACALCMCLNSGGTLARATMRGTLQRTCRDGQRFAIIFSGYIGEFEVIDDHRSGKVVIELIGRINKCGVISPRFDLQIGQIEQWTSNLLPSRQFGYIVMTTSLGIMDHEEVISAPPIILLLCPVQSIACMCGVSCNFSLKLTGRMCCVATFLLR